LGAAWLGRRMGGLRAAWLGGWFEVCMSQLVIAGHCCFAAGLLTSKLEGKAQESTLLGQGRHVGMDWLHVTCQPAASNMLECWPACQAVSPPAGSS